MAQFAIDELFTTGVQISGFIFDRSYSLGIAGQVLTATSSGVMWQADSSNADLSSLSGQIAATGTLLNNRINSLSGYVNDTFISGSGITNYVPRWNGAKQLVTGSIYDLGTGVGIGTTSPVSLLSIGADNSTTADKGISFGGDTQVNLYRIAEDVLRTDASLNVLGYVSVGGYIYTSAYIQVAQGNIYPGGYTSDLNLNIGNIAGNTWETAIKIKPGSYVGIGTTQPSGKLHVVSNVAGETVLRADGTNGTLFSVNDDLSDSLLSVNNSAGLPVLEVFADDRIVAGQYGSGDFVLANNKIGIGTSSPANKLSVIGNASIGSNSYNIVAPTNGLIIQGNVGIGTTNPDSKLQVNGEIRIVSSASYFTHLNYLDGGNNIITSANGGSTLFRGSSNNITSMVIEGGGNVYTYYNTYLAATNGKVGINTTSPTSKLHVIETTATGTRIQLGTSSESALMNSGSTNDLLILNAPYGVNSATTSNIGAKWGIKFVGSNEGNQIDIVGKTSAIYAVSEDTLGYNRGTSLAFYTNQLIDQTYAERMRIYHNGNVGIGITNPLRKLHITSSDNQLVFISGSTAGTWMDFQSSTSNLWSAGADGTNGFAIFNRTTNANAITVANGGNVGIGTTNPTVKLHIINSGTVSSIATVRLVGSTGNNAGSQIEFYKAQTPKASIGLASAVTGGLSDDLLLLSANPNSIVLSAGVSGISVFKADGKVGIGTINPQTLLSLGGLGSTSAASGITFGGDAEANLYRSAEDTIKTDGSLVVNGNFNTNAATVTALNINAGLLPGIPAGSTITGFTYAVNNGNVSQINLVETRFATGSDWTTASTRIQKRTDVTNQAYIEFNPSGASYGMALGVGANSNVEALRILSNGNIGIGTSVAPLKLNINGSIYMAAGSGSAISWANDISSQYLKYDSVIDGMILSSWNHTTFHTQQTERVRITSAGNVGINSTAPTAKLSINKGAKDQLLALDIANNDAKYAFYVDQDNISSNSFSIWDATNSHTAIRYLPSSAGYWQIYTNNVERIRINSDGYVGIATTNPAGKLQVVQGDVNARYSTFSSVLGLLIKGNDNSAYNLLTLENTQTGTNYGASINFNLGYGGNSAAAGTAILGARIVAAAEQNFTSTASTQDGYLAFYTTLDGASSEKVRIRSDGTVGIGTASTIGKLDVYDNTDGPLLSYVRNLNAGSNAYTAFVLRRDGGNNGIVLFTNSSTRSTDGGTGNSTIRTDYGNLLLGAGGSQHILTTAGNVGLGTTNPTQRLEVQGNAQIGNDSVTNIGLKITRLNGGIRTSEHTYHSSQNSPWYTYGQNLNWTNELAGTVESTQAYRPYFEAFAPAVGYKIFGFMNVTTGAFTNANMVNSLVLKSDGYVGLGTTNPNYQLTVIGANQATADLVDGGNKGGSVLVGSSVNASNQGGAVLFATLNDANTYTPQWAIKSLFLNGQGFGIGDLAFSSRRATGNSNLTESVRFAYNGNVGIGSNNPQCKLDVVGTIRSSSSEIFGFGASDNVSIRAASSSNVMGFYTSNVERLRLAANGYFGIGVDNPTTLLSIGRAGSTTATSGITFGEDAQVNLYRASEDLLKTDAAFTAASLSSSSYVYAASYLQTALGQLYAGAPYGTLSIFVGNIAQNAWENALYIGRGSYVGIGTSQPSGKLHIVSSVAGETVLRADGTNGTLFSVTDDLSDSLMSVNNSAGLPVLEVFADDRIVAGQYGSGDLVIRNNKVGIGNTNPSFKLDVNGSLGINASTSDTNWPFVVSDNSSAGSRYGLNKAGSMGFNYADAYAQLQLLGANGAYIDFTNSVGGDSNARLIYYAGTRLDLTYGFIPKATISITPNAIGIGTTNPLWALDVSGTAIRSFASGAVEPGFIVDYASSNGYGGLFIHTNGVRKWRIGNVGDTDATSPALYIWQEGVGARMYFRNNGYVGVGTTIPNTKLSVSVPSDSALGSTSDGLSITDGTRNVQLLRNGTGYNYAGVVGSGSMLYSYDRMYIVADTSNPILFHAGGAERARVQANGNVGIGTSNPLQKLQVEGVVGNPALNGTTQSGIFRISNTTDNATLDFGIRAGGNGAWIQSTDETSLAAYYSLLLNPNGGFVGVGTTVPIASLDVENSVANIPVLNLAGGIAGNAVSDLYVLNSYNTNSGVGYAAKVIGVNISGSLTAQNIPLQRTTWGGVTSATAIALGTDGPRAGTQDNAFQIWTTNDGAAGTSLTQKFSLTSAGDVGIGSVSPAYTLDVAGTIRGERYRGINSLVLNTYTTVNPASNVFLYSQANDRDSWIYLDSADTSSNWGIYHRQIDSAVSNLPANSIGFIGGGTSTLQSYISLTNGSAYFAGSVGIGTASPTNTLQVNGQIAIKGSESADNAKIYIQASDNSNRYTIETDLDANTANDLLVFRSNTVDNILVIKGDGNVGIGTTNPDKKLAVIGTAYISGLLDVSSAGATSNTEGIRFGGDSEANLYRSATDTLKTDGNFVIAGTASINDNIYGSKTVNLSTSAWTTVLTISMANHTSCYVKLGAFGDWSNHSAIAFISELFVQNGANGFNQPGTIISAYDNTAGVASDKVDIQIVDPLAAGTQNYLIQLKLISATSYSNISTKITYHIMGQQGAVA